MITDKDREDKVVQKNQTTEFICDDGLLWQEIFALRSKLRIAVEALKYYEPAYNVDEFMHDLNSCDYEQLMDELVDECAKTTDYDSILNTESPISTEEVEHYE